MTTASGLRRWLHAWREASTDPDPARAAARADEARLARWFGEEAREAGWPAALRDWFITAALRSGGAVARLGSAGEPAGAGAPVAGDLPGDPRPATGWARLRRAVTELEAVAGRHQDRAAALERDHPAAARLLLELGQERLADRRALLGLLGRLEPAVLDRRIGAGPAAPPSEVEPDLDLHPLRRGLDIDGLPEVRWPAPPGA